MRDRKAQVRDLAVRLLKTYPLECTQYAPKHYFETDDTGRTSYAEYAILDLIQAHLETMEYSEDIELHDLAELLSEDLFECYYAPTVHRVTENEMSILHEFKF